VISLLNAIKKASQPITKEEIERAEKFVLASSKALKPLLFGDDVLQAAPALSHVVRRQRGERKALEEALEKLVARASESSGTIDPSDVELLGKQLSHGASKALREIYETLGTLKAAGYLADYRGADRITDEMVARLEAAGLPKHLAQKAQKTSRVELFRLFDDPVKDDVFHFDLEQELRGRFHLSKGEVARHETPLDLTLREKNQRQANALRVLLTEQNVPRRLVLGAVERLGKVGDLSAISALDRVASRAKASNDVALEKAAKSAIAGIKKTSKMTIVLASMEVKPYCGTGGLSNVMAELPQALAKMGHRVIVLAPRHQVIERDKLADTHKTGLVYGPDGSEGFGLFKDRKDGVDYYFIENDRYFSKNRGGIYGDAKGDYGDNAERYDFFGASIPEAIKLITGGKAPDVVQLNDAHTGSAAAYLRRDGWFEKTKTIMAVHNMGGAYQGKFDQHHLPHTRINGLGVFYPTGPAEFFGQINLMKLGLVESDAAITVSRQYMKEVLDEQMGEGLHGVMRALNAKGRLWGNLNGIDNSVWNSATDPLIPHHFSMDDLSGKKANKAEIQKQFGLTQDPNVPLVGLVARLTNQKGFDDIVDTMEKSLASGKDVHFLVVGQGDAAIAAQIDALAKKYPGKVALDQKFTTKKEHEVYAGSDFFLMPSKFEPCGLPQMYALRYATVPIVRAVGGLEESIQDFDEKAGTGNGFKFDKDLNACLSRALEWYEGGEEKRMHLLRNCAESDFSWDTTSAVEQVAFYKHVINR
jgi:starch synthase